MSRILKGGDNLKVHAIAGTRTVLMALDGTDALRQGLRGFSFWRETPDVLGSTGKYLRSSKVFASVEPDPKAPGPDGKPRVFRTDKHPIQSFLWSDYGAEPGTHYRFKITPMYGSAASLTPRETDSVTFDITTEVEDDGNHGIWFNRGAIASQNFARDFGNHKPTDEEIDDPENQYTVWLSRGLLKACIDYIDNVPASGGIRACLYEFTYKPIFEAFNRALARGVDVEIIYHKTSANDKAISRFALPRTSGGKRIVHERTRPPIPHNKFIIVLDDQRKPVQVWTGSTNITPSGFCGQSNVGHVIHEPAANGAAQKYLDYWTVLKANPTNKPARDAVMNLTPHPDEVPPPNSVTPIFSPRENEAMLCWYGNRMLDAAGGVFFTVPFDVSPLLYDPLGRKRDILRFMLMEQPPSREVKDKILKLDLHARSSYGAVLGQQRIKIYKTGEKPKIEVKELKNFELEKWFWREDHTRAEGFVFFVHTKYLLIDPLGDDPAIFTGSANFSTGSLINNDENMMLIRGGKRVADIYLTEFDRLFRHFLFRDLANADPSNPQAEKYGTLEERAGVDWTAAHFDISRPNCWRRQMFFANPVESWAKNAAKRSPGESVQQGIAAAQERKAKKKSAKKAGKKLPGKRSKRAATTKTAKRSSKPKKVAKKPKKKSAKKPR